MTFPVKMEKNLGEAYTIEPGSTATQGTGQTAEDTATGVAKAIPMTNQHPETTADLIQRWLQITQYK